MLSLVLLILAMPCIAVATFTFVLRPYFLAPEISIFFAITAVELLRVVFNAKKYAKAHGENALARRHVLAMVLLMVQVWISYMATTWSSTSFYLQTQFVIFVIYGIIGVNVGNATPETEL